MSNPDDAILCHHCNAAPGTITMNCTLHVTRKRLCERHFNELQDKVHCIEPNCGRQINVRHVTRRMRPWACTDEAMAVYKEQAWNTAAVFGILALGVAVFVAISMPGIAIIVYAKHGGEEDAIAVVNLISSMFVIHAIVLYLATLLEQYYHPEKKDHLTDIVITFSNRPSVRYAVAMYYTAAVLLLLCTFYAQPVAYALSLIFSIAHIAAWLYAGYCAVPVALSSAYELKNTIVQKLMEEHEEIVFLERDPV